MVLPAGLETKQSSPKLRCLVWLRWQGRSWTPAPPTPQDTEHSSIQQASRVLSDPSRVLNPGYVLMNSGRRHRVSMCTHNCYKHLFVLLSVKRMNVQPQESRPKTQHRSTRPCRFHLRLAGCEYVSEVCMLLVVCFCVWMRIHMYEGMVVLRNVLNMILWLKLQ